MYCAIKFIVTPLRALFTRAVTIETNNDRFVLIASCAPRPRLIAILSVC